MGYGLTVYAVPLEKLRAVPGSGAERFVQREGLLDAVSHRYHHREGVDSMFEGEEPPNTLLEALAQIIDGSALDAGKGSLYGYAVQALCWYFGTEICTPIGFPTLEELDQFLQPLGCPVSLQDLRCTGSPIPIPFPFEGFPGIGCWPPEQVVAAERFFEDLSVDRADERIASGVSEVRGWLHAALHRESGQTRWLQEEARRNPEAELYGRLLRRRRAEESRPASLIGLWY